MTDRYGHPRQSIFNRRHASAAARVSYSTSQHQQQQHHNHLPPPGNPHVPALLGQQSAAAAAPSAGGRRNLFTSQLTRRLPPGARNVSGGGGLGLDGAGDDPDGDGDTVVADDGGDEGIVVRDINGDVELDEPPSLVVDDPDEIVLDMRQENESEWLMLAGLFAGSVGRQNRLTRYDRHRGETKARRGRQTTPESPE